MAINRITDSMMNYGFLSGMNKSLNSQYSLMEQMADGKRIHRPSDDPVRVIRSLQYRSAIEQNQQFTENVKSAQSWLEITDKAVADLSSLLSTAKSIVVRSISPNPDIGYEAAAKQLDGLINQAIQIANTKIGDRYIFSGQMDKTQPFERVALKDPLGQSNLIVDRVVYFGDDRKISMMTQSGQVNTARDAINLTGIDVFGRSSSSGTQYGQATTDVFNMLIRIKEELEKKTTVQQSNKLAGAMDVDGGYTGPNGFQDFAVKIDALKVMVSDYEQMDNAAGGSLALSFTGERTALPTNPLQVRIDKLRFNATVTPPLGHVSGALSLDSTTNVVPAIPLGGLWIRADAVQVETGPVRQSNAIGGALTVAYNGYGSGNAATIPANVRVRADAVDGTGVVTDASYSLDGGATWITATGAAGSFTLSDPTHTVPPPLDANDTGLAISIAADLDNAAGNWYDVPLNPTGKVMKASYSENNGGTWTAAAPDNGNDPFRFALGGGFGGISIGIGNVGSNQIADIHTVTALATDGEVIGASYTEDGISWHAATRDIQAVAGSFRLGNTGFEANIATNRTNSGTQRYRLAGFAISSAAEPAALSYSLDNGNTWIKAAAPSVTKTLNALGNQVGELTLGGKYTGLPAFQDLVVSAKAWKVDADITPSNPNSGSVKIALAADPIDPLVIATPPQLRIDAVDSSSGQVTALSYSEDNGLTWTAAAANNSQGSTVFSLDGLYAGFSVSIADHNGNQTGDSFVSANLALRSGDPALISFTTIPAPDINGTLTPSANVWSMKDANPGISGFALPDGVTADIEVNAANDFTATYSFRIPPRFSLQDGVLVSIDPNANNKVKDAYTFHMPQSSGEPDHTAANNSIGPDLDWLSDKGLADIDRIHDQVLSALVSVGVKASMYEMAGNMLESSYVNLNSVLASNEDIDMAKAIIDMKTAENTYKAALSFGARIMPTSLVDFLR